MNQVLEINVVEPRALTTSDIALWRQFRLSRPELASPYFDPAYTLAAGHVCPDAQVAIIRSAGRIEAFLPFQRRGGLIQALGAPMTDYHGVIARPGARLDQRELLNALGAERFRVAGLRSDPGPAASRNLLSAHAMVADLSGGFDDYVEARREAGQGSFLKDKRRRRALLEREVGPVEFTFGARDPEAFEFILRTKRQQLAKAGQLDIFACGWTEALLRRLMTDEDPKFGARIAAFRAGGKLLAAEIGLLSDDAYHLWFPAYDPAYSRYSPGQLMTLESLRWLSALGVTSVDFGSGGEGYKNAFAEPGQVVFEGNVIAHPLRAALDSFPGLRGARVRFERRIDRILACETRTSRRFRALRGYAGVVAQRPAVVGAAGAAIGASASIGLALALVE